MPTFDYELRALAHRQQGVFLLRQAVELGFSRPMIRRRLARHTWEEVLPRVYRSAVGRPVDWRQVAMGLALASRGVASGTTAAALYGLVAPPDELEVTAARPARVELPGIVRTTTSLVPCDVTTVDDIPATTPTRT